jgi:hypothetical protein
VACGEARAGILFLPGRGVSGHCHGQEDATGPIREWLEGIFEAFQEGLAGEL